MKSISFALQYEYKNSFNIETEFISIAQDDSGASQGSLTCQ